MIIRTTIIPDEETKKKLFSRVWAIMNFKAAIHRATSDLKNEVIAESPNVTGVFRASIETFVFELDDPYRMISRVQSYHPAAEIIEYGADPHTPPYPPIRDWVIAKKIGEAKWYRNTAWNIVHSIERQGQPGHFMFTKAFSAAELFFRSALDPVLTAIHGYADIESELLPPAPTQIPLTGEEFKPPSINDF